MAFLLPNRGERGKDRRDLVRFEDVDKGRLYDDGKIWYNHQNVPELREDDHPSGKRSVLADALPGVQGEGSTSGDDHKGMPEMPPALYLLFSRPTVACILSGVPGKAQVTAVVTSE
jgi:hypothetical protein